MIKFIYVLLVLVLLTACSDGGSSSSSSSEETKSFNPNDFVLTQASDLTPYGSTTVKMVLKNLSADDAIYVAVSSAEIDNDKIKVSPSKTMLNPSEGQSAFVFDVKDNGLTDESVLSISVTTAGNTTMTQIFNLALAK